MIKNILNFKKSSLKSILMSSIIFVSAVAFTAITISEVALASYSEGSFESFNDDNDDSNCDQQSIKSNEDSNNYTPWGWEKLYEKNQKKRESDWKGYLNYDPREIKFSVPPCNLEDLPSMCSKEEMLELADQQKCDHNTVATNYYNKESSALSNKLDNTLLDLGISKDHPKYNEALELLKTDPEIKKSIDQINSTYEENKEKINNCHSETIEFLTSGTPFYTEAYHEAFEDCLNYYGWNISRQHILNSNLPPNNAVENMSPSDKDAWYKYLSYYDDNNAVPKDQSNPTNDDNNNAVPEDQSNPTNDDNNNAVPEDQSNPANNDAGNYGCFIS